MSVKPIFVPLLHNGNGSVMANFMICHAAAFGKLGYPVQIVAVGDSHAGRGMNKTACDFLASECDVWINIDADIHFTASDVQKLVESKEELLYGVYPKKQDDAPPCVGTFDGGAIQREDGLTIVRRAGRGFMRVTRSLLEKMKEENGGHAKRFENHGRPEWEFFESGVVTGELSALQNGAPEWISEDWYFCERARQLGVPTLLDTRIALKHEGSKVYSFSAENLTRTDGWHGVEGWFSDGDAQCYAEITKRIPDYGSFTEVGTWLGRSMTCFYEQCRELGKTVNVSAVDTFKGTISEGSVHTDIVAAHGGSILPAFKANMEKIGATPKVYEGESVSVAPLISDHSQDAVFIDAEHTYDAVRSDIEAWQWKVKPGGIIAGHDFDYPDVKRAVLEFFPNARQIGRCWIADVAPKP